MYKTGLETDSLNSGGETSSSQENLPVWSNAGLGNCVLFLERDIFMKHI